MVAFQTSVIYFLKFLITNKVHLPYNQNNEDVPDYKFSH